MKPTEDKISLNVGLPFRVQVVNSMQMMDDAKLVRGFAIGMRTAADRIRVHGDKPGTAFLEACGLRRPPRLKRRRKRKMDSQAMRRRNWAEHMFAMLADSFDDTFKGTADETADFFLEVSQTFEEAHLYLYRETLT